MKEKQEKPSLESHKFRDSNSNHKNSSSSVYFFARIKGDLILSWMMAISNPQDKSCAIFFQNLFFYSLENKEATGLPNLKNNFTWIYFKIGKVACRIVFHYPLCVPVALMLYLGFEARNALLLHRLSHSVHTIV